MDKRDAEKIIVALMSKYNLPRAGWTWRWSKSKKDLGQCSYMEKQLRFSTFWTEKTDRDEFTDTVIHEIAHALTPGDGHGDRWRAVAQAMGGTGREKSSESLRPVDYPWQGVCVSGHRTWSMNKPREIDRSMCGKCFKEKKSYVPWAWTHKGKPYRTVASSHGKVLTAEQALEVFRQKTLTPAASAARLSKRKNAARPRGAFDRGFTDIEALWDD